MREEEATLPTLDDAMQSNIVSTLSCSTPPPSTKQSVGNSNNTISTNNAMIVTTTTTTTTIMASDDDDAGCEITNNEMSAEELEINNNSSTMFSQTNNNYNYNITSITILNENAAATPYYGNPLEQIQTKESNHPTNTVPSDKLKIMGNAVDWTISAIVLPLLSWTSIPLLIFFILMSNFQLIAFEWLFESEGDFFNTVDFDIIASIDKFLMFGLGMPHEILANLYHPFLDVFFAIPYLAHFVYPLAVYPIIVCIFLWTPNRQTLNERVIVPSWHYVKQLFTKDSTPPVTTSTTAAVEEEEVDLEISIVPYYNGRSSKASSSTATTVKSTSSKVSNYKLKCYLLSLGVISFIQVILCYCFPTAPPWFRDNTIKHEQYYSMIGDATLEMSPPVLPLFAPEARFEMVDRLIGYELFGGIYGKGTIKFGSFYSLHVGWTAIITFIELFVVYNSCDMKTKDEESLQLVDSSTTSTSGGGNKRKWTFYQIFMIQYLVWIFLASMYSAHHYMIDGIVAIILALVISKLSTLVIKNDSKPTTTDSD